MACNGKSIVAGIVVAFVCLAACNSAEAVNLKSIITGAGGAKRDGAFVQLSLETATQAELQSAMQAEIQALMTEELAHTVAEQLASDPEVLSGVKVAATEAMNNVMKTMKSHMEGVCQAFAAKAEQKIHDIDNKILELADKDDGTTATEPPQATATQPLQPTATQPLPIEARLGSGDSRQQRQAFLQTELREKYKGIFSKIRDMAKSGWASAKTFVKQNVSKLWQSLKPAITSGMHNVVAVFSTRIPALINKACEDAGKRIDKAESDVFNPLIKI